MTSVYSRGWRMTDRVRAMSGMPTGCEDGVETEQQHDQPGALAHARVTHEILEPFGSGADGKQHRQRAKPEGEHERSTLRGAAGGQRPGKQGGPPAPRATTTPPAPRSPPPRAARDGNTPKAPAPTAPATAPAMT